MAKIKKRSLAQEFTDTDRWTKFYRSGMAAMVVVIIGGGGYFLAGLDKGLANLGDRVAGLERKQDRFEYIASEFNKKFDDLSREIRRLQK